MCSVCGCPTFRSSMWRSSTGSQWPALECTECGAITREMQYQPRDLRPETMMPPPSNGFGMRIPRVPPLPRDVGAGSDVTGLLGARE